nr:HAD-IIIA family hydrolase [Gracilibacillus saliphilus]
MILPQAVFIDRDGTIGGNDTVIFPGEFQLYPYVKESLIELKESGNLILSFTNQPVISKGEVAKEKYDAELKQFGFDKVYLCPHQHHERCQCRKPSIGMLLQAAKDNNLDLKECVVIGDRWTDMVAAHDAGCIKILVKTGAGEKAFHQYQNQAFFGKWAEVSPEFIANDFREAVDWLLSKQS